VDFRGNHPTLLVRSHNDDDPRRLIPDFYGLEFSPNGRWLYFSTGSWPNATALHVVDTTNCRENFVCLGHIESFRGQNPVVQVDVWPHDQGHMVQMFLLSPDGRKLATLSDPMGR